MKKINLAATTVAMALVLGAHPVHAAIDDAKAADLMKAGGCSVCHAVDKKLIGPAYKDVSAKHKGDAGAGAALEKAVRSGSHDVYGKIPMPPVPASKFSDDDLHSLVEWILTK